MLYDIIHIVPAKNSACQPTLFQSVLNDTSWPFYSFSAEGELRRDETKSINHEADIKWRANKIPTDDEDKPMSCFISRDKKESRDSSIIPDWCLLDEQCVSIIRNSYHRITSILVWNGTWPFFYLVGTNF